MHIRDRSISKIQEHHHLPNLVRQVVVFLDFSGDPVPNMHNSKRCFHFFQKETEVIDEVNAKKRDTCVASQVAEYIDAFVNK